MPKAPNPNFKHQHHEAIDDHRGLVVTIRGEATVKEDGLRLETGTLVAVVYNGTAPLIEVIAQKDARGSCSLSIEVQSHNRQLTVSQGKIPRDNASDYDAIKSALHMMQWACALGDSLLSDWTNTLNSSSYDALYYQQFNNPWKPSAQPGKTLLAG